MQSSLTTQLSRALEELEKKSRTITALSREAAQTEQQANVLEQLLVSSHEQLAERERELGEVKAAVGRREREEREERERVAGEMRQLERQRQVAEENIRQLQVCVCVCVCECVCVCVRACVCVTLNF